MFKEAHVGFTQPPRVGNALPIGRGKRETDPVWVLQDRSSMTCQVHLKEETAVTSDAGHEKAVPIRRPSWRLNAALRGRRMNHLNLFSLQIQHLHLVAKVLHEGDLASVRGE